MRHIVVSVPHSGTRTLRRHLKMDHYEHFFTDRHDLLAHTDFHAHIPVRHPLDVARSWALRKKNSGACDRMLDSYVMMFRFMEARPHDVHRIEDIELVVGAGDHMPGDHADRVARFQALVTERVIVPHQSFFDEYYAS